jgi:hypothetical protein
MTEKRIVEQEENELPFKIGAILLCISVLLILYVIFGDATRTLFGFGLVFGLLH